jgi:hypothetical protein
MRGNTATISLTAFRADWLTHMPMRALCERYTISRDQVVRLKHVWHLPPRHDRRLRAKPVRQRDPTPREIQQSCKEIQATWSEDVREDRRVIKSQPVSLKRIEMTDEAWQEHDNQTGEVQW